MTSNLPLPPLPSESAEPALNLDQVLSRAFQRTPDTRDCLADAEVAAVVREVPPGRWADRVEGLLDDYSLSARQRGILTVSERVLRAWCRQPAFHPRLGEALLRCSGGLMAASLEPDSWLVRRRHPVHDLLDIIAGVAQAWYPEHPHARVLRARLCAWLDRLRAPGDLARMGRLAASWHRRYREQLRLPPTGGPVPLSEDYARRRAAEVIDQQLAGRQLPAFMVRDLRDHWWPALAGVLVREGEGGALFGRTVRALSLVIWALHPGAADMGQHAKLQRIATDLHRQLPPLLDELIDDAGTRRAMLEHIEVMLHSVLNYRQIRREPVPPLSQEALPPAVEVSGDLLDGLQRISPEDWFEMRPDGARIRVFAEQDRMTLMDQARRKQLACTRRELAWRLANGELVPVPVPVSSSELIIERLRILAQELKGRGAKAAAGTADKSARVNKARRPRWMPPPPAGQPAGDGSAESYRLARIAVSCLGIGARVRFLDEDQSWRIIMKLPSRDLLLLVDDRGLDRREIFGRDLLDALAEGEAKMIHPGEHGDYFDRVVETIEGERRHKSR